MAEAAAGRGLRDACTSARREPSRTDRASEAQALVGDGCSKQSMRRVWQTLFDPGTDSDLKAALEDELRWACTARPRGGRIMRLGMRNVTEYGGFELLESGVRVGAVMSGGWPYARALHGDLVAEGMAGGPFMIGYSSGIHESSKRFRNGQIMEGHIFATRTDMELIAGDRSTPILLVDDAVVDGITIATIVGALRKQFGFKGDVYRFAGLYEAGAYKGAARKSDIYPWDYGRTHMRKRSQTAYGVRVFDEYGRMFKP